MLLPVTFFVLLAAAPPTAGLIFKDHGAETKTLSAAEVRAASAASDVEVFEPHVDAKVKYRGVRLAPLLDAVYGAAWRKQDVLLMTCSDGYQPAVQVEKIIAHPAWLAFAHADSSPFEMSNAKQNEEHIALGPWYLVWEDSPAIR